MVFVNFLFEKTTSRNYVIMLKLLQNYAIVEQIFCLILIGHFVVVKAQNLSLRTGLFLGALIRYSMSVCLLVNRSTYFIQVSEIVGGVRRERDATFIFVMIHVIFNDQGVLITKDHWSLNLSV
jgi:hypothetical protein